MQFSLAVILAALAASTSAVPKPGAHPIDNSGIVARGSGASGYAEEVLTLGIQAAIEGIQNLIGDIKQDKEVSSHVKLWKLSANRNV
jgi:hypothetical protein